MTRYFKQYHIVKYCLVGVLLWFILFFCGSFTVGRFNTHQVRVQEQETQIKAHQQAEMKRQVPKLQAQVNDLKGQATSLNQRTEHVILPSDADEKLKAKIAKQVTQLNPKIAELDTSIDNVKLLRRSYRQLQRLTEGYGF